VGVGSKTLCSGRSNPRLPERSQPGDHFGYAGSVTFALTERLRDSVNLFGTAPRPISHTHDVGDPTFLAAVKETLRRSGFRSAVSIPLSSPTAPTLF